jgi:hypothetical protein
MHHAPLNHLSLDVHDVQQLSHSIPNSIFTLTFVPSLGLYIFHAFMKRPRFLQSFN